jgi:predicted Zn-dependent peptidase
MPPTLSALLLVLLPVLPGAGEHLAGPPVVDPGLRPDTIIRVPGGPTLALFEAGSSETVVIRVSIPLAESPDEAGVGHFIRTQAEARMRNVTSRIGARAEAHRTSTSLVYQVAGASQDLDFLVWALREGMAPPEAGRHEAARREVRAALDRRLETPEGTLALRLRQALEPGGARLQGTTGTLDRLQAGHVTAAWARSHHPEEARIVVVGQVDPVVTLASLTDLGLAPDGPIPQLSPPQGTGEALGAPEVIRRWVAYAFPLDGTRTASVLVAARHLSGLVRERPGDYEASVELWDLSQGRALVLSGAAYPRGVQAMTSRLSGLLGEAIAELDEARVSTLTGELLTELRITSRTPWGMAELVGQAWDATGSPGEVDRLIEDLAQVRAEDVRAVLETLQGISPVQEELRP